MIICNLFSGSSQSTTKPLNDYTWYEISRIAKTGAARNYFSIGDTKYFKITVEDVEYELGATIIGFNHDDVTNSEEYGQTKAGITFQVFTTSLKSKAMYPADSYGSVVFKDWYHSTMRYWLSTTLYDSLGELKSFIVSVNKKCSPSGKANSNNSGLWYPGRPDSAPSGGYPSYDEIGVYDVEDTLFILSLIECNAYINDSGSTFTQNYSELHQGGEFVPFYSQEGQTYEYYQTDPGSTERYKNKNINTIFNFGRTITDRFTGDIIESSYFSAPFPLRSMGLDIQQTSSQPSIYYMRRVRVYENSLVCVSGSEEMTPNDITYTDKLSGQNYVPLAFAFCL